jgi:trypsin-like peptidase/pre-peptidase
MKELRMRGRILTPLAALAVFALPLTAQKPARPTSAPAIDIPVARKAVVTIQALDASGQLMASGTGFFVTEGYVVTAAHVLEDAAGCRIELSDGQRQRCSVAAADTAKDVAMLTVSGRPPSTLRWGTSEGMKDGDEVTVISNPLGQLPGTVSRGIISASRVVNGTKLLQISAAISHGSSGAPVLNARGQVIAIVRSTIEAGQSLNFATATDAIRNLNNDQVAVADGQALLTPKNVINTAGNAVGRGSPGGASLVSMPQISIGQTVTGSLTGSDSLYPDTTYFKMYQFTTTPGREITIDLSSSDFDPVLIVRGEGLAQSLVDDDGGPGCSARVSQAFLARGPYRILVNTTSPPHRQTGRFTLAISEGSQHVQGRSENDCSPAGAAATGGSGTSPAPSIRVGEAINGTLTSNDSLYPDNSYFKYYQFTAPAGRSVTIDLSSDDFDPVLIIRGPDLDNSIINDDGGPGCYSRVSRTFPSTGPYRILVNTTNTPERQTGRFSLSITEGAKSIQEGSAATADCRSGRTASTHSIDVGQTQQGNLTRTDIVLESDTTYAQAWTIQGRAAQTITIDLESDTFDSYLFLRGPGIGGGRDFQDDDSGGNCHARLTATFPQSGEYEIVVNTAGGDHYVTGAFTLSVTSGSKPKSVAQCHRSNQ